MRALLGSLLITLGAVVAALLVFGIFLIAQGKNPLMAFGLMYQGAFGTWFSWQNTLTRAAPLMLTALCTALPARIGLIVIGGEGALVLGGLAAAAAGVALMQAPASVALLGMTITGMVVGGLWIALAGWLRHYRGVNETISGLLLAYIAIAMMSHLVEGPLRDPTSLNKPSTTHIGEEHMLTGMFGSDIHWGFGFGVLACFVTWVVMCRSTFGFAASMVGGNLRAAKLCGLPVGFITLATCALAGAAAGLAGAVEVAAVHGNANASLIAGYGYTGILVAFLARHHPLAIIPVAILLGGLVASGGLLQRRMGLPDATILVLQGLLFISILASETLQGRLTWFLPRKPADPSAPATTAPATSTGATHG
jgi:general nucleoside transport system permease protein